MNQAKRVSMFSKVLVFILLFFALFMLIRLGYRHDAIEECKLISAEKAIQIDQSFELAPLAGTQMPITPEYLDGKVALIDFWATWCPPCRRGLPHLEELASKLAGEPNFILLPVSVDEGDAASVQPLVVETLKEIGVKIPVYYDLNQMLQKQLTAKGARVEALPTTLIVDSQGRVRAKWTGFNPANDEHFLRQINTLLDEIKEAQSLDSPTNGQSAEKTPDLRPALNESAK
jgi:thiol-disulfide isomerase/thioredoxin